MFRFIGLFALSLTLLTGCSTLVDSKVTREQTFLCNTKKVQINQFSNDPSIVQLVISGKKSTLAKATVSGQEAFVNTNYIWKPSDSIAYLYDKSNGSNMACTRIKDLAK